MTEMAKGTKDSNAVLWAGMGNEAELESMVATGADVVKIIKPYSDNSIIYRQLEHAEKCGVLAVGMDVDHAFNKKGEYDNVVGAQMSPKTLSEIKSFVEATKLPFIIKGVLVRGIPINAGGWCQRHFGLTPPWHTGLCSSSAHDIT
jgi:hypothetical protein